VLREEWQRSTCGELRVALVLGEPGMGKTRLATELALHCAEFPVAVLAHRGVFRSMPPLGSWAETLGLRAGGSSGERVCPVCGSGLGHFPPLECYAGIAHDAASCADALRYHLVEWIPGLLATASRDRPIVLVLDDVHRSDDAVWQMLGRLGRDCPGSRLFVLATARPAELAKSRAALEALDALDQDVRIRRVALAPLSRRDIRQLAADTLGQEQVPAALVDWLTARAQGNPRFVVGLLEALVECDADFQESAVGRVPERLASWIRTELAGFDGSVLAVLELLAVAGDALDLDDLARITSSFVEHVAVVLEQLSRAGMVVEHRQEGSLRYAVTHVLTREVLYGDIGAARQRVLHRRVAATLLAASRTEAATSHYLRAAQAGDGESIVALIELLRAARQQGSDTQAWRIVSALRNLLPADDDRWNQVLDALIQQPDWAIADRTEHYEVEIGAVQRMRQLLPRVRGLQQQAKYRLWLAGLFAYGAGNVEAGVRECGQAFALCQRAGYNVVARSAAIELAKIRGWSGDLRGEEAAARQLLGEAEQAADQQGIAEALAALGHALGWQGLFDEAEKVLLRSIDLAAAAAQLPWMSQSLALLACLDACRGDLTSARARCAQAAASSPPNDPVVARCGEFIELLAGDLIMAQAHARNGQRHAPAPGTPAAVRLACRSAMAAAERSELVAARRHLGELSCLDSRALGILEPLYWWAQGVVARAEGRFSTAATALRRTVDGYVAMGAYALVGFALVDLAEVTVCTGDGQTAASIARSAQDSVRCTDAPIHQTLHLLVNAWALIRRGHHEAAAQAALGAVEGFSAGGYVLLAARARISYAHAIRRYDRGAARQALGEAAVAFQACGATMRHQQARTPLRQLRSDAPSTAKPQCDLGSLTPRERQVAELAAGGYPTAQIATQLHIGVRTVETHLARSYRKLGVTSKLQLARRAADLGIHPPDP
jgi:DNA-binding CsgD family transcriptional regulator